MKLFKKKEEPVHSERKVLSFGINNYPGSQNDLNGCVNDVYDVKKKIGEAHQTFDVEIFTDAEVTISNFKYQLNKAVDGLIPGDKLLVHYSGHGTYVNDNDGDEADGYDEALFLYDGVLIDDDIHDILVKIPDGATVILIFDSCFSGTVTKSVVPKVEKNKFVAMPNVGGKSGFKLRSRLAIGSDMKWITFSGSGEHQTSADAYIDGRYNGAFTYFALKTLKAGITYKQWAQRTIDAIAASRFEQVPQIEGNEALLNNLVFYE